ncbi:MAG: 16S rRNA (cytosine(1402)-N(4))-methyltransferase RsmH [Spirochaetaceae bacterium]|nr:16S rRNA (cytosine(1402)-N(4))-methyltransferase RsmH [Spirochaetaceae bacterium]
MDIVHYSVLKEEVCEYLKPDAPGQLLVDGTMGEGGHSQMFLSRFSDLNVIGLDADREIQKIAMKRLGSFAPRVMFRHTWFNDYFKDYPEDEKPDRILLDLGISVFHYERSGAGFSFSKDEKLDMRLNREEGLSAEDIVNDFDEKDLADLIYEYGEERLSRKIASAICRARKSGRIVSSLQLAELIKSNVPPSYRYGRIHPATRTFQAIRIAVNSELDRLDEVIKDALDVLKVGGRLGIITFHSLEDRKVKHFFREMNKKCICPPELPSCQCGGVPIVNILTRKPVVPTEKEVSENPPSRSAKFRVVEKLADFSVRNFFL